MALKKRTKRALCKTLRLGIWQALFVSCDWQAKAVDGEVVRTITGVINSALKSSNRQAAAMFGIPSRLGASNRGGRLCLVA